jgi:hypothetical protein
MWGGSNVELWRKEREHKCKAACSIPNVTGSTFLGNFLTVIGQVPQPRNKNQKRPDMLQPSYRQSGLWSLVCQASISNVTFKPTARQQDAIRKSTRHGSGPRLLGSQMAENTWDTWDRNLAERVYSPASLFLSAQELCTWLWIHWNVPGFETSLQAPA